MKWRELELQADADDAGRGAEGGEGGARANHNPAWRPQDAGVKNKSTGGKVGDPCPAAAAVFPENILLSVSQAGVGAEMLVEGINRSCGK